MASLINLTRANEIGANCYYVDLEDGGVLLDAGMHPKHDGLSALPHLEKIDRRQLDAIFLTHAHHDHSGALPLAMERHPDARVFLSEPTYFLADRLLHNSVNVMKKQREELAISEYPLYSHSDVGAATKRWQACHLKDRWTLQGYPTRENDPVTFEFYRAGHILGSVAVELNHRGRRILYTGDINFANQSLIFGADLPPAGVDTLIIETTRGAQPNPDGYSRQKVRDQLITALNTVYNRNGVTLMPIFAMGKTQELLTLLYEAQRHGEIPHDTFFIGGLSKAFTEIYDRLSGSSERQNPRLHIQEDIRPQVFDWKTLNSFRPRKNHLYLLPSGMMSAHTTSNMFASNFLHREENAIFFVGYCDPDSPAGKLRATPHGEKIRLNPHDPELPVKCQVEHFDFTSHATRESILEYILTLHPRHCLLVHGDAPALTWFKDQLTARAPEMKVTIPPPGEEIDL
jgi:Cft2 family RNA processing exonuclease